MAQPLAQLEGKYDILEKLAEGGMGAIYKVRHLLLEEVRVVKILKPGLDVTGDMKERFLREARAAIQLRHPNVVQLFDFTLDESGTGYIVMEYIDGLTFEDVLSRAGPPPLALTLELATQCLDALEFLHRQGYVHRDIAPDNLMLAHGVEQQPVIKILDLGIAKGDTGQTALTRVGTFLGKIRYASPEQLSTSQPDPRTDIYSFGIVLYELLTGAFPIAGTSRVELISGHLEKQPLTFERSDPEKRIPPALRDIVMGCLEKDRDRRFQTAALARERILEVRDGLGETDLKAELRDVLSRSGTHRLARRPEVPGSTQESLDVHFPPQATDRHDSVPSPLAAADRPTVQISRVPPLGRDDTGPPEAELDPLATEIMRDPLPAVSRADVPRAGIPRTDIPRTDIPRTDGDEKAQRPARPEAAKKTMVVVPPPPIEAPPQAVPSKAPSVSFEQRLRRVAQEAQSAYQQISTRMVPVFGRLNAWLREHQRLATGALGAMCVLLIVVIAVMLWPQGTSTPQRAGSALASLAVVIDAAPWAEVLAIDDGREQLLDSAQLTPLRIDLMPGTYAITLRGPRGEERTVEAVVESGSEILLTDFAPDPSRLLEEFGVIEALPDAELSASQSQPVTEP